MVDPVPALQRIVAVLQALPVQHVYVGAPDSLDSRVNAYVTLDRWSPYGKLPRVMQHRIDYGVTFAYRVAGAEATAETDLATLVGAFVTAMLAERLTSLNGTVTSLGDASTEGPPVDFSRAAEPQYAVVAGQEFRLFPGVVHTIQQESY